MSPAGRLKKEVGKRVLMIPQLVAVHESIISAKSLSTNLCPMNWSKKFGWLYKCTIFFWLLNQKEFGRLNVWPSGFALGFEHVFMGSRLSGGNFQSIFATLMNKIILNPFVIRIVKLKRKLKIGRAWRKCSSLKLMATSIDLKQILC